MSRAFLRFSLLGGLAALGATLVWAAPPPKNNPPKLQENPTAALPTPGPKNLQLEVEFTGDGAFQEPALRAAIAEQLEAIDQQGLTAALADDAAFFLGIFYRKNGYSQAEVKWQIDGAHRLELAINEGPLTQMGEVNFQGVAGEPEATLRDYVLGSTRERFPRTKGALPFVESDVDAGVERIRGLYLSEGFLDSVVDDPKITFSGDKTRADVRINVHEGTRYSFGKLSFEGDLVFFPNDELVKKLEPFSKKPYTPQLAINMERTVVYYYKTHGYYDVKVEAQSDPKSAKDGIVPVVFQIDSGSVYRFDGVSQEGLDQLNPKFLPSRFAKLSGRFYNPETLDETFREMMRTGLFKQLKIEPRALPDHTIELHMKVQEAKPKELGAALGYGTFEGPIIAFSAADRDLFGTGRPLSSNIELSQRFTKGEILYRDPWFLESQNELRLRLFGASLAYDGYSTFEEGGRVELARKFGKHLETSIFLLTRSVQTSDNGIEPLDLGATHYTVNSLGTTFTVDYRDSPINPTRGLVLNLSGDFAGNVLGSSIEFLRGTARFSYYVPIQKTLLAIGARAGIIQPLSGDRLGIPIDERFFNGGSRSVRSFSERKLGPEDRHGYPIGGDTFTTVNVEYQFPLYGDLLGALFVDAGSVGVDPATFGTLRYGLGGGLRYRTPVGPLRIDYGVNPSPKGNEKSGALSISFGVAF